MYQGERKRCGNKPAEEKKVTFTEGLRLWADQWRWSNIKKIWQQDYRRVYSESMHRMNKVNQRLGR